MSLHDVIDAAGFILAMLAVSFGVGAALIAGIGWLARMRWRR